MRNKTNGSARATITTKPPAATLADLLRVLNKDTSVPATRMRDLRSAVERVAEILGQEPANIMLDLPVISGRLSGVNPIMVGISAKTMANIRSGFLTAVKLSGLMSVQRQAAAALSPPWPGLMAQLSGKRAHLGLSRFARYASAQGIDPTQVNDAAIGGFIAAVRQGSLHRKPNVLHRQVTLIWNEVARLSGLPPVTVASFSGPIKRVDWTQLTPRF